MGAIVTDRKIFDVFQDISITREKTLRLDLPQKGKRKERIFQYRQYLQYTYCMPIEYYERENIFIWNNYSAYKFLKFLYEYFEYHQKIRWEQIKKTIKFNKDKKITLYAAGAIEKDPNGGAESRKELKKFLKFTKTKIINPCDFVFNKHYKSMKEFAQNHSHFKNWEHMCKVVEGDIAAVKQSHAIVVWIDEYIGTGSHSECTLAKGLHKPVYGILAPGFNIETLPWLMGNLTKVFKSHDAFRKFVLDIE